MEEVRSAPPPVSCGRLSRERVRCTAPVSFADCGCADGALVLAPASGGARVGTGLMAARDEATKMRFRGFWNEVHGGLERW
jgi:hypothetical protein